MEITDRQFQAVYRKLDEQTDVAKSKINAVGAQQNHMSLISHQLTALVKTVLEGLEKNGRQLTLRRKEEVARRPISQNELMSNNSPQLAQTCLQQQTPNRDLEQAQEQLNRKKEIADELRQQQSHRHHVREKAAQKLLRNQEEQQHQLGEQEGQT